MKSVRFLLPFTERIDLRALASAVHIAKERQAALVPLALIPLTKQQWAEGPSLEAIEQANDFLEAVKDQTAQAGVEDEPYVLQTLDVVRCIRLFAQEMRCEGILLFLSDDAPVLLPSVVLRKLLDETPVMVLLIRLHPKRKTGLMSHFLHRIVEYIQAIPAQQEQSALFQASSVPDGTIMEFWPGEMPIHTRQRRKEGPHHARGTE